MILLKFKVQSLFILLHRTASLTLTNTYLSTRRGVYLQTKAMYVPLHDHLTFHIQILSIHVEKQASKVSKALHLDLVAFYLYKVKKNITLLDGPKKKTKYKKGLTKRHFCPLISC